LAMVEKLVVVCWTRDSLRGQELGKENGCCKRCQQAL
jgi:hypothetical protein